MDEIAMKRISNRRDEIENFAEEHLKKGVLIPQELVDEHKRLTEEYNQIISASHKQKTSEFLNEILSENNKL